MNTSNAAHPRMRRSTLPVASVALMSAALFAMPDARAQQWLVNNVIQNHSIEVSICEGAQRKGQRLPDICAKYPQFSRSKAKQLESSPAPPARPGPAAAASLRFTPAAGSPALKAFVDDLGRSPDESQQLLQVIATTKAAFEKEYGPKGWKDNVAGAFAFFIGSIGYIWSGNEPDAAAQDRLFEALTAVLAQSPEMAKASPREKAALYDTLVASTSIPLLLYIDGSQKNDKAQMEQARGLAAEYSRKILNAEPQALAAML